MIKKLERKIYALSKEWGSRIGLDLPYFVKNGFWVAVRQGIGMVSGLALSVAFARLATQEVFGQYQFVLSVLSVVSIVSIPGFNTAITQSVARGYDGEYKKVVRMSFFWSLLGTPILLLIGGYYYIYQSHPLGVAFMIASVFFPFFYAPNTWDAFLQGKGRFDVSARFGSIQSIISSIVTIVVIFSNGDDLIRIIVTYLFSYAFLNGLFYWKAGKYLDNNRIEKGNIKYGYFLSLINLFNFAGSNIDKIVIGILLGAEEVAAYTIISMIAFRLKDLLKTFNSMLLPKFATLDSSLIVFFRTHRIKLVMMFIASLVIGSGYYFAVSYINDLLFGSQYSQYSQYSRIFAITIFFALPTTFLGYYAAAKKNKLSIIIVNPVFYAIKIIINIYFVYRFGLAGAVVSFNISMFIWFLLSLISIIWEELNLKEANKTA
ncbi:MAG: oligosaccharide flippase family protein [Candidatus Moranbacteria bacterium]|nr:oligosaccharide flippase family protein [Candidatus Moranbacteria bacterium]